MQHSRASTPPGTAPAGTDLRFRDQAADDERARDDATLACDGPIRISSDEDVGSDPYNRTGRFNRAIR